MLRVEATAAPKMSRSTACRWRSCAKRARRRRLSSCTVGETGVDTGGGEGARALTLADCEAPELPAETEAVPSDSADTAREKGVDAPPVRALISAETQAATTPASAAKSPGGGCEGVRDRHGAETYWISRLALRAAGAGANTTSNSRCLFSREKGGGDVSDIGGVADAATDAVSEGDNGVGDF